MEVQEPVCDNMYRESRAAGRERRQDRKIWVRMRMTKEEGLNEIRGKEMRKKEREKEKRERKRKWKVEMT